MIAALLPLAATAALVLGLGACGEERAPAAATPTPVIRDAATGVCAELAAGLAAPVAAPARGDLGGQPFVPARARIEADAARWRLTLDEGDGDGPAFVLDLGPLAAGARQVAPFTGGRGFARVRVGGAAVTRRGDVAFVVEPTRWEVRPYDPDGDMRQAGGTFTLRVAACLRAEPDAWIAGEVSGELVYRGDPRPT